MNKLDWDDVADSRTIQPEGPARPPTLSDTRDHQPTPAELKVIQGSLGIEEAGYGPRTKQAVAELQMENGIPVDEDVSIGPRTWAVIQQTPHGAGRSDDLPYGAMRAASLEMASDETRAAVAAWAGNRLVRQLGQREDSARVDAPYSAAGAFGTTLHVLPYGLLNKTEKRENVEVHMVALGGQLEGGKTLAVGGSFDIARVDIKGKSADGRFDSSFSARALGGSLGAGIKARETPSGSTINVLQAKAEAHVVETEAGGGFTIWGVRIGGKVSVGLGAAASAKVGAGGHGFTLGGKFGWLGTVGAELNVSW